MFTLWWMRWVMKSNRKENNMAKKKTAKKVKPMKKGC